MIDSLLHNLRTIGTHHCDGTVGEEAADEIERLRAEVAGLRAELLKSLADNAALRERVKVLEDALRGLMVGCKYCNIQGQWHWHEKAIASNEALDAARAALAARKGEA